MIKFCEIKENRKKKKERNISNWYDFHNN